MQMTLPNIFSMFRVLLSPVFFYLIISENPEDIKIGVAVYAFAAITDYLDGMIARKFNVVTRSGKFLDPLADKILTTCAFAAFVMLNIVPLWMVVIILFRDIGTTVLRILGDNRNMPVVTSRSAKAKTFLQMAFIAFVILLILAEAMGWILPGGTSANEWIYSDYTFYFMFVLTVMTVWTAIEYCLDNKRLLLALGKSDKAKQ